MLNNTWGDSEVILLTAAMPLPLPYPNPATKQLAMVSI